MRMSFTTDDTDFTDETVEADKMKSEKVLRPGDTIHQGK